MSATLQNKMTGLGLVLPAMLVIALFFIFPLLYSIVGAFQSEAGWGLENFNKAFELYKSDILFTFLIVCLSTLGIGIASVAIGGYLTLGENPRAVSILRWLYRWPMFVPFIVAAQVLRTFLSKNGMFNTSLDWLGVMDMATAGSYLDWRGIVFAFVWKQTPFVTLLVAGAMASLDRATIEAARNLGASRLRILIEIIVPQVSKTLTTGLILSFVTMMSVLSVPLMINAQSPTMITANIAFRINAYGDFGVANALGMISLIMTGAVAWIYLRSSMKERA